MPDYTACMNWGCSRREGCARYMMAWSSDSARQSVFLLSGDGEGCVEHWPVSKAPFKVHATLGAADDAHAGRRGGDGLVAARDAYLREIAGSSATHLDVVRTAAERGWGPSASTYLLRVHFGMPLSQAKTLTAELCSEHGLLEVYQDACLARDPKYPHGTELTAEEASLVESGAVEEAIRALRSRTGLTRRPAERVVERSRGCGEGATGA